MAVEKKILVTSSVPFKAAETCGHGAESAMGTMNGGDSFGGDTEEALGTTAAFGGGIAEMRLDVALGLEAIERGVDGSDRDVTVDARFDFLANGDTVGVVTEAEKGKEHDVFEFAEEVAGGH